MLQGPRSTGQPKQKDRVLCTWIARPTQSTVRKVETTPSLPSVNIRCLRKTRPSRLRWLFVPICRRVRESGGALIPIPMFTNNLLNWRRSRSPEQDDSISESWITPSRMFSIRSYREGEAPSPPRLGGHASVSRPGGIVERHALSAVLYCVSTRDSTPTTADHA